MPPSDSKPRIRVGARQIVEFLYRSGGLSPVSYHTLSPQEGTRTHQAFYQTIADRYRRYTPEQEVTLQTLYDGGDQDLQISGRADLILFYNNDERVVTLDHLEEEPECDFVLEVKTVGAPLSAVCEGGEELHWAQVLLYTAMFYGMGDTQHQITVRTPADPIVFALAYVSQETLETKLLVREINPEDLFAWFKKTCERYLQWAQIQEDFIRRRDQSLQSLRFPFTSLRDGQRDLIELTVQAIRQRTPLLAEAPTGIGKTMATLYPALKSLLMHKEDRIFYLTAKTSTRQVAEQALETLYEDGLVARSITLTAKEQICIAPQFFCDKRICPYAVNFYDNLPGALEALMPHSRIDRTLIEQTARQHRVCPHELQLDIARYCDVIIGDYNHALDPRVRLDRFFSSDAGSQILLFDEAHNLVDRSRDMYSLTLERKDIVQLQEFFQDLKGSLPAAIAGLLDYFDRLAQAVQDNDPGFPVVEPTLDLGPGEIAQAPQFRAIRKKAPELRQRLANFLVQASMHLDLIDDLQVRRALIEAMASASFAVRVQDEFWDESYVICFRSSGEASALRLLCLDVSNKLVESYRNRHAAVFFSATLRPLEYFRRNFCGSQSSERPLTVELASPFPPEHLQVIMHAGIETRYKERQASAMSLAQSIALTALLRGGHQLCFFPSFAYLRQVLKPLQNLLQKRKIEIIVQKPSMPEAERQAFLDRFRKQDGKPLLGFAVLGGIFGEGIDLVGSALETVQIVGVGIPQLSPERELMKQYYDERMESGFNFAYRYPGFNKVLQAAGRLIRSEDDTGCLVLYDSRLDLPEYRQLLPEHWEVETVTDLPTLKAQLQAGLDPEA